MDINNLLLFQKGLISKEDLVGDISKVITCGESNKRQASDEIIDLHTITDKCPTIKFVRKYIKSEATKINETFEI